MVSDQYGEFLTAEVRPLNLAHARPQVSWSLELFLNVGASVGILFSLVIGVAALGGGTVVAAETTKPKGPPPPPGLSAVRAIARDTPLVTGGRPPALLLPAAPAFGEAAALLARGLAELGISAERVNDIAAADPAARTVICLGSMVDNPLIERLYWNRYTFADAVTPGDGRFLLHTVCDPYPFSGGHNVVIIGCHDPAGAALGVRRLLALIQNGRLPCIVESGPPRPAEAAAARRISATAPEPTLLEFLKHANGYLQTGMEAHARKAIASLEIMVKHYAPDGPRGAGTTLTYQRLPFDEEMASWEILCAWDAFEECPLLTDAQRLAFSNVMLRFTRELVRYCSEYKSIDARYTISWNHTSFPLLGLHFGARYFNRYYRLPDMPEILAKAKLCFTGQARSWKPQEDADLYMTLTTEHAYLYCMAEDRMDAAVVANLRRTADYIVGWSDNLGRSTGFGDATIITTPRFLGDRLLPLALWWSGDGGYQWLMDHYTSRKWRNPLARGATPVRPDRFTGLNVFKMDPAVYDYTQTKPSYNEPLRRAEVPREESFDKIAFRENWDPRGQYLLLDGLARGKHLHYDGNSIVGFSEGGERWLLDHDYLTRNTTEHTMLSIMRHGRSDQLVPSLAGLAASADLPAWAYTRTYVRDYSGCDWQRQILWRKNGWFLVADTVTPRATDDYAFDLTWKTIDSGGNQQVDARGDFAAARGLGEEQTRHCSVFSDPKASGGKGLQLDANGAQIAFGVNLAAGDYQLTVIGEGRNSSDDTDRTSALQIAVDGGTGELFGLTPRTEETNAPAARISLTGAAPHLLLVTPVGHRSPLRVDRFVFTDTAGITHVFEAESLPAPPPPRAARSRQLMIKPVDAVTSWVTNHDREGIPLPISILHQRQEGRFGSGQKVQFASLMFTSRPDRRRELQPVRIAENLVAIQGSDPGVVLLGPVEHSGISAAVEAGLLTPQTLALAGLRRFHAGGLGFESSAPVGLEMDFSNGKVTVVASANGVQLTLSHRGRAQTIRLAAGTQEMRMENFEAPSPIIRLIDAWTPAPKVEPAAPRATSTPPTWSAFAPDSQIATVKREDLGDGEGERLLVCRGNSLHCLQVDGRIRWSFETRGRVRDVAVGELRPNPGREILVGSADTYLYLLSATGELLEKHQMRGVQYARSHGDNPYGVYNVGIWDLDGDGKNEIVATLSSYDLQVRASDWRPLWNQHQALHGSVQLSFEDLDCDGRSETLLVGDRYGNCVGMSPTGKMVYRGTTSIGDVAYVVTSLDGGKTRHIVSGSSAGDLMATSAGTAAKPLWRFDNFGYAVNRLRAADLDGDGRDEVLVASGTGTLYVLNAAGQIAWQDHIGYGINDVVVIPGADGMKVAYCDESGPVRIADARGRIVREIFSPASARQLTFRPTAQGAVLLLALADGRLVAYDLPAAAAFEAPRANKR